MAFVDRQKVCYSKALNDFYCSILLMVSKFQTIQLHLLFWLLKIGIEFYLFQYPHLTGQNGFVFWTQFSITWAVFVSIFYLHYSILTPRFLIQKRLYSYLFWLLATTLLFASLLSFNWDNWKIASFIPKLELISFILFGLGIHLFAGTALCLLNYWIEVEKTKNILENEIKEAELKLLKSQTNPHFLFNTLNNIYALTLSNSANTPNAIKSLKELLEYLDNCTKHNEFTLEQELNCIKSFIALNKLRYKCALELDLSIENPHLKIDPMLLLPFVENAYKHGNTNSNGVIYIKILESNKNLIFESKNEVSLQKRKDTLGGIGIKNIEKRLQILYQNKFNLRIENTDNQFTIKLNLFLD